MREQRWGKVSRESGGVDDRQRTGSRNNEKIGHTGARTQDHSVISTALYRLSYTTSVSPQPPILHRNRARTLRSRHLHLPARLVPIPRSARYILQQRTRVASQR